MFQCFCFFSFFSFKCEKNSQWRPSDSGGTVLCSQNFTADDDEENVNLKKKEKTQSGANDVPCSRFIRSTNSAIQS